MAFAYEKQCDGIPFVRTFESLVELSIIAPNAQNGCILAIVITIIRKNLFVSGERMIIGTLNVKISGQKRVIRIYHAKEDARNLYNCSEVRI